MTKGREANGQADITSQSGRQKNREAETRLPSRAGERDEDDDDGRTSGGSAPHWKERGVYVSVCVVVS